MLNNSITLTSCSALITIILVVHLVVIVVVEVGYVGGES